MPLSSDGKIALVIGSTKSTGRSTVERLSRDGVFVVINYRHDPTAADALVHQLGGPDHAMSIQADVLYSNEITHLVNTIVSHHGKIDILVANAGVLKMTDLVSTTEADFDTNFDVNAKGVYFLCQAAASCFNRLT